MSKPASGKVLDFDASATARLSGAGVEVDCATVGVEVGPALEVDVGAGDAVAELLGCAVVVGLAVVDATAVAVALA